MEGFQELANKLEAKIDNLLKNQVAPETVDALKSELQTKLDEVKNSVITPAQMKEAVENEIAKAIDDLKNKGGDNETTFAKEVAKNIEAIKSIVKNRTGSVEIKANTTRASVTNNTMTSRLSTVGQLGRRTRSLYDKLPKITMTDPNDNGQVSYVDFDEANTIIAAGGVVEGGQYPESTVVFAEYKESLKKIGDTLPVTEEFGKDVEMCAQELERFLELNVESKIDEQLINGNNSTTQLNGILNQVPAYTPVASGIADANIYDLAVKMVEGIVVTRGSKYKPDMALMNTQTLNRLKLKKDANNNYIFPLVRAEGAIDVLEVIEDNNMPNNQMIVGDSRYATIYEKTGVEISEGMIDKQFIGDLKTIKARKRMLLLIRTIDRTGFLKCTNITTALTTLATAP